MTMLGLSVVIFVLFSKYLFTHFSNSSTTAVQDLLLGNPTGDGFCGICQANPAGQISKANPARDGDGFHHTKLRSMAYQVSYEGQLPTHALI